jgi:TRAP-type mannitol/chloroaromatic compound transport system permease large subunit
MSGWMPAMGWGMFACLGVLTFSTGLPVWALLIGVASAFAAGGVVAGWLDMQVLGAISTRTLGLLDNDLLQTLPLYAFVGMLLQRLELADTLYRVLERLLRFTGAGSALAALALGALIAPMNGSVSATSTLLGRLLAPRLGALGAAPAFALTSAASTIGVVVPPSLVLLLLGDAMLRAHTEASNLPGYVQTGQRIINSQDVFHAALLPAALTLAGWVAVGWWRGRQAPRTHGTSLTHATNHTAPSIKPSQWLQATLTGSVLVALLAGVFSGILLAVEAAASAALLLVVVSVPGRKLSRQDWSEVLWHSMALSGALLALLVGASTFSLVFRLFGSDRWLAELVLQSQAPAPATALGVLLLVAACAWMLDAFEMIFLIIPVVAPLLIVLLGDAQQTAVLLLLVLQLSFLIPPMGYALMMTRNYTHTQALAPGQVVRALLPFWLVQCIVICGVLLFPWLCHALDESSPATAATMQTQDVEELMRSMAQDPR